MTGLTPWALGPFEILIHAEGHYRLGSDLDRRLAIVGFDNAIELTIHTYLSLHPLQRQGRSFPRADVDKWLDNFHTKVEFFIGEVTTRGLSLVCDRASFIWYHEVRNGQYHVGGATIPQTRELEGIRAAAFWVFSVLFEIDDIMSVVEHNLVPRLQNDSPKRNDNDDRLIDREYGVIELVGKPLYVSELVHQFDPFWYSELVSEIRARDAATMEMDQEESV